jgi:hypothetical protein
VSLLVASLGLAGGILLGRAIARALRRGGASTDDAPRAPEAVPKGTKSEAPREDQAKAEVEAALAAFPCHLGDVILASSGDEAWLAGGLVLSERLPMAVLFIAPDAGGDRAILARPRPDTSLLWLMPVTSSSLAMGREPPTSLEHESERFERTQRVPYRAQRIGTGAPDVGEEVIFAEYKATMNQRIIVVLGKDGARVFRGRVLEEGTYDLLPGSPEGATS